MRKIKELIHYHLVKLNIHIVRFGQTSKKWRQNVQLLKRREKDCNDYTDQKTEVILCSFSDPLHLNQKSRKAHFHIYRN